MSETHGRDVKNQESREKKAWKKPVLERLSMRSAKTAGVNFMLTDAVNNYS